MGRSSPLPSTKRLKTTLEARPFALPDGLQSSIHLFCCRTRALYRTPSLLPLKLLTLVQAAPTSNKRKVGAKIKSTAQRPVPSSVSSPSSDPAPPSAPLSTPRVAARSLLRAHGARRPPTCSKCPILLLPQLCDREREWSREDEHGASTRCSLAEERKKRSELGLRTGKKGDKRLPSPTVTARVNIAGIRRSPFASSQHLPLTPRRFCPYLNHGQVFRHPRTHGPKPLLFEMPWGRAEISGSPSGAGFRPLGFASHLSFPRRIAEPTAQGHAPQLVNGHVELASPSAPESLASGGRNIMEGRNGSTSLRLDE
ncbi:hypothetical protein NMY22_g18548 [Coprinellus aureogranulatus]|nr:hypothetical protein NMY22_g18548 [Coprinellus aureogranulatus]